MWFLSGTYLDTGFDVVLQHGDPGYREQGFGHLEGQRPEPGACREGQPVTLFSFFSLVILSKFHQLKNIKENICYKATKRNILYTSRHQMGRNTHTNSHTDGS